VALLQRIKQLIDEGVVVSRAAERVHREMGRTMAAAGESSSSDANGHETETDAAQTAGPGAVTDEH
jgi:hypothetical protein